MNEYREQLKKETRRFSRQNMSLRMMDSHNTYKRESSAPATIYSTRMRANARGSSAKFCSLAMLHAVNPNTSAKMSAFHNQ